MNKYIFQAYLSVIFALKPPSSLKVNKSVAAPSVREHFPHCIFLFFIFRPNYIFVKINLPVKSYE